MSDRPIIFSAPMVRALLDGRKSQTRRVLKHPKGIDINIASTVQTDHPIWIQFDHPKGGPLSCVKWPYAPGDRLYVREAWRVGSQFDHLPPRDLPQPAVIYAADRGYSSRLRPSIHMPRWASRLPLIVTDVRVQRLQEISETDAKDEGLATVTKDGNLWKWGIADSDGLPGNDDHGWHWREWEVDPRAAFKRLWNSLHGPDAWSINPWVVAVSFTVHRCNIDQMEPSA